MNSNHNQLPHDGTLIAGGSSQLADGLVGELAAEATGKAVNGQTPQDSTPLSVPHSAPMSWIILAVAGLLVGCSKTPKVDPRTEPPLVMAVAAAPMTDERELFSGVVAARVQSDLGFRVNGKVIERLVDAGQIVKRDQPLIKIDPVDLDLAITIRKAELDSARARSVQVFAEETRQEALIKKGATAQQVFDDAKAAADTARAEVESATAALRIAENAESYATVCADADGTVVDTFAEPGHVVAAGETVVKLAHTGPREALVYLPETVRPEIGSGAIARLYHRPEEIKAKLRQLSNAAEPLTRTYEARYVLDEAEANLPLGATVTIQLDGHGSAVSVPLGAITDQGGGTGVWVLAPGATMVRFRPVQIDHLEAEEAVIAKGLAAGETVVALGAHLLADGEQVRLAKKEVASHE